MPPVIRMTVKNPAKIVTAQRLNAAVETAEGQIEGQIGPGLIEDGAVTTAKLAGGAVTADKLGAAAVAAAALAGVLVRSVSHTSKTDTGSFTSNPGQWAAITGLSKQVTVALGERVFVLAVVYVGGVNVGLRVMRNNVQLAIPASPSARRAAMAGVTGDFAGGYESTCVVIAAMDAEPPEGTHTYSVELVNADDNAAYVNRGRSDNDTAAVIRAVSTLTCVKLGPEATL